MSLYIRGKSKSLDVSMVRVNQLSLVLHKKQGKRTTREGEQERWTKMAERKQMCEKNRDGLREKGKREYKNRLRRECVRKRGECRSE